MFPGPVLVSEPHLASNGPASSSAFPPGGYLLPVTERPPPAGAPLPPPHDHQGPYLPVVVNQHYYMPPPLPPQPGPPSGHPYLNPNGCATVSKLRLGSALNLANAMTPCNVVHHVFDDQLPRWQSYGNQLINQGVAMSDQMCTRFSNVMTLIDGEKLAGHENDLFMYGYGPSSPPPPAASHPPAQPPRPSQSSSRKSRRDEPKGQIISGPQSRVSGDYFSKVELYANSKLPLNLPPLQL